MSNDLRAYFTIERFESGNIDPARFDHEAHVYMAWLYLADLPREKAIAQFDAALQRFTTKIGATAKYNATITWLFLLLIAERRRNDEDWAAFRTRNDDLFNRRPSSRAA